MSRLPPSLEVTPRKIRDYLGRCSVSCQSCGYALRGLPGPTCPECGAWTDLTGQVRTDCRRLIESRLESLGTVDDYLVMETADGAGTVCRLDEVEELKVVNRWSPRTARWLVIVGLLAVAESLGFAVVLLTFPSWDAGIGIAVFMVIGLTVATLVGGMFPDRWVVVKTANRISRSPLRISTRAGASEGVARLNDLIEARRDCAPTTTVDPVAEGIRDRYCRRCGYDLNGPRCMVHATSRDASFLGVLTIVSSLVFSCCGSMVLMIDGDPVFLGAVIASPLLGIGLGFCLISRRRAIPAVRRWSGSGQCSACGWRSVGQSAP